MSNFGELIHTIENNQKARLLLNSFDATERSVKFTCMTTFSHGCTVDFVEEVIYECLKSLGINRYLNFEVIKGINCLNSKIYTYNVGLLSLKENVDERIFWSLCSLRGFID